MEGAAFCYRPLVHALENAGDHICYQPLNDASDHYPLTFDQRLSQADHYRQAIEQLDATLGEIERLSSHPTGHTGNSGCVRCNERNQRVVQAFYDYYLCDQSDGWNETLVEFRRGLPQFFATSETPLEDVHGHFRTQIQEHLRKDLCTLMPHDPQKIAQQKADLDQSFQTEPLEKALLKGSKMEVLSRSATYGAAIGNLQSGSNYLSKLHNVMSGIQTSRTREERSSLYVSHFCAPSSSDTPQLRNLKSKYAKEFESGTAPHLVLRRWKNEARALKYRDKQRLAQRLAELKLAQSAHLKNQNKKKMREEARTREAVIPRWRKCEFSGCTEQMDLNTGGILECVICDWLASLSRIRKHSYYCSYEHIEKHSHVHYKQEHACVMGDRCFHLNDPDVDVDACGVCSKCMSRDTMSFFCSQQCFTHNFERHQNEANHNDPEGQQVFPSEKMIESSFIPFALSPGLLRSL